jgi:hypothetical protein
MPSLTYAELAKALGITPESANRLARRKRWPRAKGNDGRTRVMAPEEELIRADRPQDKPLDSPPDNAVREQIARLEGELAGMREALAESRARAGAAEARAEAAETRASEESAKTAQAIAAFQSLAERLEALAEARRPWWRRLVG